MQLLSSRIVLFLATLFLSFAAFFAFNLNEAIFVIQSIVKGEVPDNIELLAFDFYQSITIFVTGIFFTVFISQFEKLYYRLSQATDKIPDIVRNEVSKVTEPIQESFKNLTEQLADGMITRDEQVYRALEYERETGILKNHSSDDIRAPRNILLNVHTMATIFETLNEAGQDSLHLAGYRCGRNFIHNFRRLRNDIGGDFRKAIDAWIEYDANAGWGKFEVNWADKNAELCIFLKHNFLMEDEKYHTQENDLNYFVRGYIEGVFSAFPATIIENAGFDPETLEVIYLCTFSRDGRVLYSPEEGSKFCIRDKNIQK